MVKSKNGSRRRKKVAALLGKGRCILCEHHRAHMVGNGSLVWPDDSQLHLEASQDHPTEEEISMAVVGSHEADVLSGHE